VLRPGIEQGTYYIEVSIVTATSNSLVYLQVPVLYKQTTQNALSF